MLGDIKVYDYLFMLCIKQNFELPLKTIFKNTSILVNN